MKKSYVHDNIEVVMTGRIAQKTGRKDRTHKIYEIVPKDEMQGIAPKWVRMSDLYEVAPGDSEA